MWTRAIEHCESIGIIDVQSTNTRTDQTRRDCFGERYSQIAREKWMVKDEDDRGMGLKFWGDKP
jgi:hypothetical protein